MQFSLREINFHGLRHTYASHLVESGGDIKAISVMLGHADVATTMNLYVHPSIDARRKFAGCKEKLQHGQITELAQMIIETHSNYKLTEFMLFFQRFKRCRYGKFYGAVDPMVILQALATFGDERARVLDDISHRKEQERQRHIEEQRRELEQRYMARVPEAFTPKAPISFTQYRLMGYDSMSDEELAQVIADLRSGRLTIPQTAMALLAMLSHDR